MKYIPKRADKSIPLAQSLLNDILQIRNTAYVDPFLHLQNVINISFKAEQNSQYTWNVTQTRSSSKHRCRWKAVSITYSEGVSVLLP